MSTIHNPSNFKPEDYEVYDYFDNKFPEYHFGMTVECFEAICNEWRATKARLFPDSQDIYHCAHCGNGLVRYIVCCLHKPTGKNVVFGDICVARLGFTNHNDFKAAQIRAKAELAHKRIVIYQKYLKTIEKYPALEAAVKNIGNPAHEKNMFAHDVVGKLKTYGELSERQITALVAALKRDEEYAARKATEVPEVVGDAPQGREVVEGVVLCKKLKEGDFGDTFKMLVKLTNNSKVWCTCPSEGLIGGSMAIEVGAKIKVRATWTRKLEDKTFAFGKRPYLISVENKAAQNATPENPTQNS